MVFARNRGAQRRRRAQGIRGWEGVLQRPWARKSELQDKLVYPATHFLAPSAAAGHPASPPPASAALWCIPLQIVAKPLENVAFLRWAKRAVWMLCLA